MTEGLEQQTDAGELDGQSGIRVWLVVLRRAAAVLGLIASMGAPFLLIVPYWVAMIECRGPLERLADRIGGGRSFLIGGFLCGMLIESIAVLDNLGKPYEDRALFHPVPGPDLLLGIGFYSVFALTWFVLLQRIRFSTAQVIGISAAYGIVVEQDLAILVLLFTTWYGFMVAAMVGLTYAGFVGPAHMATHAHFEDVQRRPRWFHFPLAIAVLVVVGHGLFIVFWIPVLAAFPLP